MMLMTVNRKMRRGRRWKNCGMNVRGELLKELHPLVLLEVCPRKTKLKVKKQGFLLRVTRTRLNLRERQTESVLSMSGEFSKTREFDVDADFISYMVKCI